MNNFLLFPRAQRQSNNRLSGRSEALSARTDLLNGSSDPLKHLSNIFFSSIISLQINACRDRLSMDFAETLRCPLKDRFGLHIRVYRKLASASKSHTFLQSRFSFRGRAYCQMVSAYKTQTNFRMFSDIQSFSAIKRYP